MMIIYDTAIFSATKRHLTQKFHKFSLAEFWFIKVYIAGLPFQWASTSEIQLSMLVEYKVYIIIIISKLDIAE